jgi:hypothetical protein
MDGPTTTAAGPAAWTMPTWAWIIGAAALLGWHAWLTLALFGPNPQENLLNDQPIVSGVHPQHLFLGQEGAKAIVTRGRTSVYVASNLAGFPKTPIFDGARVAELMLVLGGGTYRPAAYKVGFACCCMLVPIFILLAAKAFDLGNATSLLATFLGQIIWWGPHGRAALITGDCELYLAALAALAHIGCLVAYHRTAGVGWWFGIWITGCIGWFLQPLFYPLLLPVLLTFYISVGVKHDFLTWHVAFWLAETLAFVVNLPWLADWLDSWWLRTPLPIAADLLQHRTFVTVWNAPIWGGSTNRFLALALSLGGGVGVIMLNQTKQRPTARMLCLAGSGSLVLAVLGISWEPLGAVGTAAMLAPALWFACIPAAHAALGGSAWLWRHGRGGRGVLVALVLGSAAAFHYVADSPQIICLRCVPTEPLEIGLDPNREAIVQTIMQYTSNDARILWEDTNRGRQASRWAALLPLLTDRTFIGGLDPDGFIEHSSISLTNQVLDGRPIGTWTDDKELADYCRRYNVRWVVAWSPAVIERFESWPDAVKLARVVDGDAGWLFEIKRTPNFALKGEAELVEANGQYIVLANVTPNKDGEVVISMHYQAGMRASPGRVQVDRAKTGDDPIDFVRLRLAVPAARVTISWDR